MKQHQTSQERPILTKQEARAFIGIGEDLFEELLKRGKITGRKVGKKKMIFFKDEIETQLKQL